MLQIHISRATTTHALGLYDVIEETFTDLQSKSSIQKGQWIQSEGKFFRSMYEILIMLFTLEFSYLWLE